MKHSLQNDTGLNATKPVNQHPSSVPVTGATEAPQEKLLDGKLVSFKNAEENDAPILVSYNSPDTRRQ